VICKAVERVLSFNPELNQYIVGIGLSIVGLVDSDAGILIRSPGFLGTQKIDIIKILMERFPYPVFISNDMQAEALAELIYGYGRKYNDFVTIGITYGVGAAVVLDRETV
jgi:predicted NBD/HSP70 family sugar kinase